MGEIFGEEGLVGSHAQQVKLRFLPVAEEEIFAHLDTEKPVYLLTSLHSFCRIVIGAAVGYLKLIKKIVSRRLARRAHVGRTSFPERYIHTVTSFLSSFAVSLSNFL